MHDIIDDYINEGINRGICHIIDHHCPFSKYSLYHQYMISILMSRGWYSGNRMFPITHPDYNDPQEAFAETEYLWDPDTEYGRRRIYVARQLADMRIEDRHERRMVKIKRLWNETLSKLFKVFKQR